MMFKKEKICQFQNTYFKEKVRFEKKKINWTSKGNNAWHMEELSRYLLIERFSAPQKKVIAHSILIDSLIDNSLIDL